MTTSPRRAADRPATACAHRRSHRRPTAGAAARASVPGREFGRAPRPLAAICRIGRDAALDPLDEALAAGWSNDSPPHRRPYRFAHMVIRETLYQELHRVLARPAPPAQALAALSPDGEAPLSELAHHAPLAGQDFAPPGAVHLRPAGRRPRSGRCTPTRRGTAVPCRRWARSATT